MFQAALLALALAGAPAEPTLDRGRQLFQDIDLGANGKTCALCHSGGRSLDPERLQAFTGRELGSLANHCLALRMESPRLPAESVDLQSLALYLRTFALKRR